MSGERNGAVRELGNGNPRGCRFRVPAAKTWVLKRKKSDWISSYIPFLFLIGSVIGLLQVKDLFETHPANMWTSIAALIIFCLSHATKMKINRADWAQLIDAVRVLSAALVVASLLSVLLPDRLCYLPFLMCLLLAFIVIYLAGVIKVFHSLLNISRSVGQRITGKPEVLPR